MLQQTFVMAVRVLVKNWLYTGLSIISLALGLIVFLTDLAIVEYGRTLDQDLTYYDRLYHFNSHRLQRDGTTELLTSHHTADRLRARFPQLEQVTQLFLYAEQVVESENFRQYEQIFLADENFFQVFDYPFVAGNPVTAFNEPSSVILSRAAAARYFGNGPVIGESITINDDGPLRVTAVIDDLPPASHFRTAFGNFNVVMSAEEAERLRPNQYPFEGWGVDTSMTFAVTSPEFSYAELQQGLRTLVSDDWPETYKDILEIRARPLDTLLDATVRVGNVPLTDVIFVLGIVVLITACVNFTNLLIAQNVGRTKEVALRKALGSGRGAIVAQFLIEGVLISVTAITIAIAVVPVILDFLSNSRDQFSLNVLMSTVGLLWLLLLAPFVTLIGSAYPAITVSAARPSHALGGGSVLGRHLDLLRGVIVTVQFALSIALLIGTSVMWLQQSHIRDVYLQFAQDQILVIDKVGQKKLKERLPVLKRQLLGSEGVLAVAASNQIPSGQRHSNQMVFQPGDSPDDFRMLTDASIDPSFFNVYDIDLVAGRLFSIENSADIVRVDQEITDIAQLNVLINERAVERMGWSSPDAALGKVLIVMKPDEPDKQRRMVVVGVVEDAPIRSIAGQVDPMLFRAIEGVMSRVSVKIAAEDIEGTVSRIDQLWDEVYPEFPIQRQFLDEKFETAYQNSQRDKWLLAFSCLFALMISAIGLFGLAGYVAETRTKEIGVRKVMGASVRRIVRLLLWDFSKPVLLANLIAWPLAYLVMRSYLDGYADRIDLSLFFFIGAGLAALMIAWLVVAVHVIRAARTHPVHALRHE